MKKSANSTIIDIKDSSKKIEKYDHIAIENKWQKKWASSKIYKTKEDSKKPKYYVLDMFPYPSGEGLHVGHPKGFIATDVVSRYRRMKGYSVLHPMGFDAFGLPAENYALKTKTNPEIAVKKNVARYKKQLELLGFDYDWSREVNTTDPNYYKWTQWIFLQLFKKGLAYESYEPINWCPSCKTGLANEDVENGRCERCGTPVEKKPMRQWVLKITDYAERLLKDLDLPGKIREFTTTTGSDAFRPGAPVNERNVVHCLIKHWSEDTFLCMKWKKNDWRGYVVGGIEGGESVKEAAQREVMEETGYKNVVFKKVVGNMTSQFYQELKKHNRRANVTTVYLELLNDEQITVPEHEKDIQDMEWVPRQEVRKFVNRADLKYEWDLFTGTEKQELLLDWPRSIVELQKNWIGKSEGALIKFKILNSKIETGSKSEAGNFKNEIEVFTTRPDTLFGVTYVVLAPEHKLVSELLKTIQNKKEVETYINRAVKETEIERTDIKKEKTGVELKGIVAINPANQEKISVWIADYVLPDYGTGAVMAVPAHDERDWEFATKFGLGIKHVVVPTFGEPHNDAEPVDGVVVVVFDKTNKKYACLHWRDPERFTIISGGKELKETYEETAKRELQEEAGINEVISWHQLGEKLFANYWNHSKSKYKSASSMQYLAIVDSSEIGSPSREGHENFEVEWKTAEEILEVFDKTIPKSRHLYEILARAIHLLHEMNLDTTSDLTKFSYVKKVPLIEPGILINSDKFNGQNSKSIMKEITTFTGGRWTATYKLRDWVFSRQRYWGEPIPIIHCQKCGVVPVPEKDLPVKLPKVKFYEPTGTGESPLAAIDKWVNVKCPTCKGSAKRETNTMPQWAGSSWYYLRYEDNKNSKKLVDPKKEKYWSPVDLYVGGAEHATRHLIYARFWHKFLYDLGVVSTIEPFAKLQHVGLIMGEDGRKMSKRFGNVVNPDEIVKTYGADTMRIYEMFMGPFDQQIAWSTSSMVGARRFIERVWKLGERARGVATFSTVCGTRSASLRSDSPRPRGDSTPRALHKAIKKVTDDIENLRFNTAISTLMITVNELEKGPTITREQFEILLKLLSPFAPHVAEELWTKCGNKKSIHLSDWPKYDNQLASDSTITIVIQVNGKVRGSFETGPESSENLLKTDSLNLPEVKKWLVGKEIKKVIVVKGKLVSIVTS